MNARTNGKLFLSVIIPAYNEEKRLLITAEKIQQYLKAKDYSYEVLVVDDGSGDKTYETISLFAQKNKEWRVIKIETNKGKGNAIKQGMLQARGSYCLFTDSDNSTPIEELEKFWPELKKGIDIVIASRSIKGAILDPPQPLYRRILGVFLIGIRKIILGLKDIEDTQCGFKCFNDNAAKKVFSQCRIDGFSFDIEALVIARKSKLKIKEIPVYWKNDFDSKVSFKKMAKALFDLLKIRWNLLTKKYSF